MSVGLRYVGDPFVDTGVATLVAAANVTAPEEVTEQHIEAFIQDLQEVYIAPFMSNYLGTVVFANVDFANPGMNTKPQFDETRRRRLRVWLSLYREGWTAVECLEKKEQSKFERADPGERCMFSGDPAVVRVSRVIIPMTSDESNPNFVPEGRPRLPVAGWVVLALLAMPYGTLNSGGKVLLIHTLDTDMMVNFARRNLELNRRAFALEGVTKRPNYRFARTQLMEFLVDSLQRVRRNSYPLTAYHFTSSGQGSWVAMYHLASSVLSFIYSASRLYGPFWDEIVRRAARRNAGVEVKEGAEIHNHQNYFYEDLFDLPANAAAFLQRYLLRKPYRAGDKDDPRRGYNMHAEREVISWPLIGLFMEKIMNIDRTRIEAITALGDRLADYIQNHDPRLYGKLYRARRPDAIRRELHRACNQAKDKGVTLVPFEEFVQVFFINQGEFYAEDWYLAYDLLLVRVIEKLSTEVIEANREDLEAEEEKA